MFQSVSAQFSSPISSLLQNNDHTFLGKVKSAATSEVAQAIATVVGSVFIASALYFSLEWVILNKIVLSSASTFKPDPVPPSTAPTFKPGPAPPSTASSSKPDPVTSGTASTSPQETVTGKPPFQFQPSSSDLPICQNNKDTFLTFISQNDPVIEGKGTNSTRSFQASQGVNPYFSEVETGIGGGATNSTRSFQPPQSKSNVVVEREVRPFTADTCSASHDPLLHATHTHTSRANFESSRGDGSKPSSTKSEKPDSKPETNHGSPPKRKYWTGLCECWSRGWDYDVYCFISNVVAEPKKSTSTLEFETQA